MCFTDADHEVYYDDEKYLPVGFKFDSIQGGAGLAVDTLSINIDDTNQVMTSSLLNQDARNKWASIHMGVVTETDVAKALYAFKDIVEGTRQEYRIRNLLVRDIMSTPLISVNADTDVSDIIDLMLKKNISSVPITQNGRITGVVTRNSLVQAL